MRYLGLFLCLLFTLVFSACSFVKPNQFQDSGEVGLYGENKYKEEDLGDFQKGTASDWIPEGYTGAIVVITEANSGAIVIQTGDQLLYRNEIYGFQVLLGKEWKGGKICKDNINGIDFFLAGETDEWGDLVRNPSEDKTSCRPLGYTPYSHIEIFPHEAYLKLKQEFEQLQNDKWKDLGPYRINNRYRFRFIQVTFGNTLKLLLPDAECKDIIVPAGGGEIEYQLYSCTEIEDSQLILSGFSTFDL